MSDENLRAVRRAAATGDPVARYRQRVEWVRRGDTDPDEIGLEVGDYVEVIEHPNCARIKGPWKGIVTKIGFCPSVKPEGEAKDYKGRWLGRPSLEELSGGLFLVISPYHSYPDKIKVINPGYPIGK